MNADPDLRKLILKRFRAVFNWVSKVIRVLLWFCFTSLCDWLKPFAPLSRPIRSKTQTYQSRLARVCTRFPALGAGYMYLLRVLIGSLGNLCLLWLAGVITLVLVLRHSFEKRSNIPLTWLDLKRVQHPVNAQDNQVICESIQSSGTSFTSGWLNDEVKSLLFISR